MMSHKIRNLGLLVMGFGLGQGALFLANTYLYWQGHYDLIGAFGTAHALTTFLYFIADWGGSLFLAKEVAGATVDGPSTTVTYIELSLVRFIGSALYAVIFFIYCLTQPESFFGNYLTVASFGMIFYAFNTIGLLDGAGRSGISGLTQAIPIFAVGVALPFTAHLTLPTAGYVVGATYTAAIAISVSIQVSSARVAWRLAVRGITARHTAKLALTSLPYMLTAVPGQLLFRAQVILASQLLSTSLVALFIYCRQIIGIGYQALGFYLRVDLRDFAEDLKRKNWTPLAILRASMTVRLGAVGTLSVVLFALALSPYNPLMAKALAAYAPCIVAIAASATLQRALVLQSRATIATVLLAISTFTPIVMIYPFFSTTSIYSLIIIEFAGIILQCVFIIAFWNRR